MTEDLTELIKQYVEKDFNERSINFKKPNEIHVTQVTSFCPVEIKRQMNNSSNNEELKFEQLKYFYLGKMFHENIEKLVSRYGIADGIETKVSLPIGKTGWKLIGTPDLIINHIPFELKTTSNLEYSVKNIEPSYSSQVQIYNNLFMSDYGYLVFIQKNNFEMKQIKIPKVDLLKELLIFLEQIIKGKNFIGHKCEYC